MLEQSAPSTGVIIIGGGLAGLTAATFLARAGCSVTLVEQARNLGGRAVTQIKDGFHFNLGPHALYRAGRAAKILAELGVHYSGGVPAIAGYGLKNGQKQPLPGNPLTLLTTGLLGVRAKLEVARLMATLETIDTEAIRQLTVRQWLDRTCHQVEARRFFEAIIRVATYANAPEYQSAGAAVAQLQMVSKANVLYLDRGWQTLVDGLHQAALEAGVEIITQAKVTGVDWGRPGGVRGVTFAGGHYRPASTVVIAASPQVACHLVGDGHTTILQEWAETARPVRAACLDVALARLPQPKATFAVGLDQPLYLSVHTAVAKLAPKRGAVIHVAKYLSPEDAMNSEADLQELEQLLDLIQPGWRTALVAKRFLPNMVVSNALVMAEQNGLAGRPGPAVPGIRNLFVIGDWVGPEGMLSDASVASAKEAAELILASKPEPIRALRLPTRSASMTELIEIEA